MGWGCRAWQSAQGLFEHHTVDNVVLEYSPGPVENSGRWDDIPAVPAMLALCVPPPPPPRPRARGKDSRAMLV